MFRFEKYTIVQIGCAGDELAPRRKTLCCGAYLELKLEVHHRTWTAAWLERKLWVTYQEAADLAGPLKPSCVIPGHWDMFEGNLGDPKAFKAYYELKYSGISLIPEYGQCVRLTKRKHDIEGMTYV